MYNVLKAAVLLAPTFYTAVNAETVPELITDLSNAFSSLSAGLAACTSNCACPSVTLVSPIVVVPAAGQTPVTVTALNQPITTTVTISGGNTVYNIGPFNNVYNAAPTVTNVVVNIAGNTIVNNIIIPTTTLSPMAASASATPVSFFLESAANPAVDGLPIIEANGALVAGAATDAPQTFLIINGQLVDPAGNVVAVNTGSVYRRSLLARQSGTVTGSLRYGSNSTTSSLSSTFALVDDILEFIYLDVVFEAYACLVSQVFTLGLTNGNVPAGCFGVTITIQNVGSQPSSAGTITVPSNNTTSTGPVSSPVYNNSTVNGTASN